MRVLVVEDEGELADTIRDGLTAEGFTVVVLIARLRALVRRGAPERPTVLRAGDLLLDPAARRVAAGTPRSRSPRVNPRCSSSCCATPGRR